MSDVFLSYTHSDESAARSLAEALAEHGWSVFWDRTIPVGKTWDQVLESELTTAGCVVVLWSSASVSSEWVRAEAEDAAGRKILIPVLLEDGITIPLRFRALQAARLVDSQKNLQGSPSFKPLLQAIEELSGAPVRAALVQGSGTQRQSNAERELRDVYLGYANASSGPARRIRQHLAESGVEVLDWAEDFRPGSTILEELEQAAKRCKAAVFLFSMDDPLDSRGSGPTTQANLIFELGFFVHAVGRDRVALLVERGVTLPADIAGLVFFEFSRTSEISTILSKLKSWLGGESDERPNRRVQATRKTRA